MSSPQRWGASAFAYVGERGFRLLAAAVSGLLVARHVGPDDLGILSYCTATFGLAASLSTMGMHPLLVREFSTRVESSSRRLLISALAKQVPVAVGAASMALVVLLTTRWSNSDAITTALALLPLPLAALEQTPRAYLEAKKQLSSLVRVGMSSASLAAAARVAGIVCDAPLWVFGAIASLEATAIGLGYLGECRLAISVRDFVALRGSEDGRRLAREAYPLLLSSVAVTVYMRVDVLMLGALAGNRATGLYSAAARISELWYVVPMAAVGAIRPLLARYRAVGDDATYGVELQRFMFSMNVIAMIAVVFTFALASPIIGATVGSEYSAAAEVLRVHILALPFVFLGIGGSQWFVDYGLGRSLLIRSALGAVLNVALNLLLIPLRGPTGAAVATLVAYATSGMLLNGFSRSARPLLVLQCRALFLRWPPTPHRRGAP